MEYAFLTEYRQLKADKTCVKDWYRIDIGEGTADVWQDRKLWCRADDGPEIRNGKYLEANETSIWVNVDGGTSIRHHLWMEARRKEEWQRDAAEAWLRSHGYRPIEDVIEGRAE